MASELSKTSPLGGRAFALRSTALEVGIAFANLAVGFSAHCAKLLRNLQLARMRSVLMSMSDAQLAQIGITRSEVAQYARSLVIAE